MNFLRRSFTAKITLLLLCIGLGVSAVLYIFGSYYHLSFVPFGFIYYGLAGLFVLLAFVFWFSVSRPLKGIIMQMQALLTGREYKKFFTDRVDEVGIMAHFFNEITRSLHRFSGDVAESKRMAGELEIASSLQHDILPRVAPQIPGLVVAIQTKSAAEVGGDSFGFIPVKDAAYLYIGDAAGDSVAAGILMTMVNTLVTVYSEIARSAQEMIYHVNRQLKRKIHSTLFMTMTLLKWDVTARVMSFVGAGHEYILTYSMKTGRCEATPSGGIALGMVPDNSKLIKEQTLAFENTDLIVLYTDGVIKCKNTAGEEFGLKRLEEAIAKYASQYSPVATLEKIMADVASFIAGTSQLDDMTLIAIQRVDG
ncbi:MAG: SpoIIE family protein phosphatase [Candidatus Peregrinibacteria bacterium]|nr:SpoIIE family protein phosphatase [Candidatus Peregrinibacteria bacterium]